MVTSTHHHTTSPASIALFYISSFEDSFGLRDGESVTKWQAYDPITTHPIGPRGGDTNPAYIRLWMADKFPAAVECQIVQVVQW